MTLEAAWQTQHGFQKAGDVDVSPTNRLKWHISSLQWEVIRRSPAARPAVDAGQRRWDCRRSGSFPIRLRCSRDVSLRLPPAGVQRRCALLPRSTRWRRSQRCTGTLLVLPTRASSARSRRATTRSDDNGQFPATLTPGTYDLSIGILDLPTYQPKAKLAIVGLISLMAGIRGKHPVQGTRFLRRTRSARAGTTAEQSRSQLQVGERITPLTRYSARAAHEQEQRFRRGERRIELHALVRGLRVAAAAPTARPGCRTRGK